MSDKAVLKGDKKGGLLDTLVNGGEFPTVKVEVSNDTLVNIAIIIILSIIIAALMVIIVKSFIK